MKVTLFILSVLSAFALAHGPDADDDMPGMAMPPKAVAPKGTDPRPSPTLPLVKPSGLTKGLPKPPAGYPKIPKGLPKAAAPKAGGMAGMPGMAGMGGM